MKKSVLVLICALLLIVSCSMRKGTQCMNGQSAHPPCPAEAKLPESLAKLYPPQAKAPLFFLHMAEMANYFDGMVADTFEKDTAGAIDDYGKFKEHFMKIADLVPEWKEYVQLEPLNALEAPIKSGDPAKVMPAIENMANVCYNCHDQQMVRVKLTYRWGSFKAIRVTDPITNQQLNFKGLMQYMGANYAGISIDTEQGQPENARKQLREFNARFTTLKGVCMSCHTTERKYYVDQGMQGWIDGLGKALDEPNMDHQKIQNFVQGIGMESCAKCHLVHVPGAFAEHPGFTL